VSETSDLVLRENGPSLEPEPAPLAELLETGYSGERRIPDHWYLAIYSLASGQTIEQAARVAQMRPQVLRAIMLLNPDMRGLVKQVIAMERDLVQMMGLHEAARRLQDETRRAEMGERDLTDLLRATKTDTAQGGPKRRLVLDY